MSRGKHGSCAGRDASTSIAAPACARNSLVSNDFLPTRATSAFAPLAPLLAVFLCLSCVPPAGEAWGRLSRHAIVAVMPAVPAAWASLPEPRMTLAWRGADGKALSVSALPGESVPIELERGRPQALLAVLDSKGRLLEPAGALYPEALTRPSPLREAGYEDSICLDWAGGYAASLALAFEKRGLDPWGYDLYRLVDGALARTRDPWTQAPLDVARLLSSLDFRIDRYKEKKRFTVSLPCRAWSPESPFEAAPLASTGGGVSIAQLTPGLWRFLGIDSELLVSVDEKGGASFVEY